MPAALHPQALCGSQSTFTGNVPETLRPGEKRKGRRQNPQVTAAAKPGQNPYVGDPTMEQWPPSPHRLAGPGYRPPSLVSPHTLGRRGPQLLLAAWRRRPTPPPPSNLCRQTHSGLFFPMVTGTQSFLLQTVHVGILRTANDFVNTSQKNKQC